MGTMRPLCDFDYLKSTNLDYRVLSAEGEDYKCIECFCDNPECGCKQIVVMLEQVSATDISSNDGIVFACDLADENPKAELYDGANKNIGLSSKLLEDYNKLLLDKDYLSRLDNNYNLLKATVKSETEYPMPVVKLKKIGRNEACPCGSGKKYKKCCLQ